MLERFTDPKKIALFAIVALGSLGIAGCGAYNDKRGIGDAPRGTLHEEARPVWQNIDKFPNIVAFCIGENGIYSNTRTSGDSVDVVANDPNCAEGGVLYDK